MYYFYLCLLEQDGKCLKCIHVYTYIYAHMFFYIGKETNSNFCLSFYSQTQGFLCSCD